MQQAPAQAVVACSQCGRILTQSDLVQIAGTWVCGDCKPAFLSRVMAGNTSASQWHYGGFWIRFVAKFVDGLILGLVQMLMALAFFGSFLAMFSPTARQAQSVSILLAYELVAYGFQLFYEAAFLHYKGATPGKMALGLKVVRVDGGSLGWGVAIGRYFMTLVSGIILCVGYIIAGFDDEKRALHDRVCDTRVVYAR